MTAVFPTSLPGFGISMTREPYIEATIQKSLSGAELRYSWWTTPRYKYRLAINGTRSASTYLEFQQILTTYIRQFGQLSSFLLADPEDYVVTAHGFGLGDNSTKDFQIQRSMLGQLYDTNGGPWNTSSTPRTNLALQSDTIGSWTAGHSSVSGNAYVAPDGGVTADKVIEASDTGQTHEVYESAMLANSTTYCLSAFVKRAAGTRHVALRFTDKAGTTHAVKFDLDTNTETTLSGSSSASGAIVCSNSWVRVYACFASATGGTTPSIKVTIVSGSDTTYNGDGTSAIALWGVQCEAASYPTEKITTVAAAVTANPSYWPTAGTGFEPIWDVVPGQSVYIDGALRVQGTDYTIGTTGLVSFTGAPTTGQVLTWTGNYWRRVRFADPGLASERIVQGLWSFGAINLISVTP